jgi:hypothetical protein
LGLGFGIRRGELQRRNWDRWLHVSFPKPNWSIPIGGMVSALAGYDIACEQGSGFVAPDFAFQAGFMIAQNPDPFPDAKALIQPLAKQPHPRSLRPRRE